MRRFAIGLAASALALALGCAGAQPGPAAPPAPVPAPGTTVPAEYIVTLAPGANGAVLAEVFGRFGVEMVREISGGVFLLRLKEDPGLPRMKELQAQDSRIKAVQPNYVYRMSG